MTFTRPSLPRLTLVELRKMVDTRAGFWLLLSTAGLTLAFSVIAALVLKHGDRTYLNIFAGTLQPSLILMPVVGILLVTSEWSQRTAMTTFTLVPERSRVLVGKLLAGSVLGLVAYVVSLVVALIVSAVAGFDMHGVTLGLYGQALLNEVAGMLGGLAFGAAILASAPAIVLSYVLPTAWAAIASISALHDVRNWLDETHTTSPLLDHMMSGREWAQLGTSLALWLLLPIAIGVWRFARSDPR